jgi:pimeloyl-ACP methyl ester carboxylesterase
MMKENARTVGELGARLPVYTKEDASRISARTLLVNGSDSPKFFHSIVDKLGRFIEKSEVVRIQGSAHFPHLENPTEFDKRLREFLKV